MPEEAADLELVQRCKSGELSAFETLVLRHQDKIFNLVLRYVGNREDAADITQEVFLKAYRAMGSFAERSSFGTWLYRIAVNTALSFMRKQRSGGHPISLSAQNDEGHGQPHEPPDHNQPLNELSREETEQAVQQAISSLDEEYRIVVILKDIEGLNYETIAGILGCPKGTVKSRLHRARLILRDKLKRLLPDTGESGGRM